MTDHALRLLRENARLAELAAFPFDFDIGRASHGHVEEVRLASGAPLDIVAGDAGGGTYFVCADGSMLYADSEGSAGIIGSSVDEALEIMIGLAEAEEDEEDDGDGEEEPRQRCGLEGARAELRAALGFPERSPVELEALLQAALLRTEPDFVLLNGTEHNAYQLLDSYPRPPLWEPVLASGHADLALLRAGDREVWDAVAENPVRRRLTLRAAQFDRADDDLEALRHLLRHEAASSMTDELRLAAVLVGLRGDTGDLPLLNEVRETDFDTACGLGGMPEPGASADELREWAQDLDDSMFGADPADEPLSTWTDLARDQGMTELARVALIRDLDEIVMDQSRLVRADASRALTTAPLRALARDFEELGDRTQALRAQRLNAALQETAWDRVSALLDQARLEREDSQLVRAVRSLATVRTILTAPGDDSLRHWQGVNFGRFIAEEHYRLSHALADANLPEEARSLLRSADSILGELSENAANGVRELAEGTAARVREIS
ncbi:hypothetical protein ACM01_19405 [Streptomyces viridochromogenes]|uniref:Uncharacterized protein n=1 Tax=Streptomyces viridochromogenes TaxID=1938 RepID=A0A0J7ZD75_STRVR|nr:hypothetical protein [Streptomyces viridochromogenes]KMS73178.1 hypothetical protein ACM01_19405 [Streptomyces viridochromogenes]KOG06892.1 hypothetical protein ADK36_45275 [Streptomyces viridochromogenes]KOG12021.1 hypothetical protein ADK35_34900 [Streptomyces viridochromogenes]